MLVFARVSAMLAIFPVFSSNNFPIQLRIALGALVAYLISVNLPPAATGALTLGGWITTLAIEILIGLFLGFVGRMCFYGLDAAGNVLAVEMGIRPSADINPVTGASSNAPGLILNYLAITLFFSLDMHHWFLIAFQKTYDVLPIGGAHLSSAVFNDLVDRTGWTFLVAIQIAAPLIAVSFIISLVFSVLARAVPQMNVFSESFAFRAMAGLTVFGMTLSLMAEHISNYLRQLPEDMLRVAQLLGKG